MKNKIIFSLIIPLLIFFSCNKYLDEVPDNRQEISSLENISELLVGAYSDGSYVFVEWKTDNVMNVPSNRLRTYSTENYQYRPVVSSESQDTPSYYWNNAYNAIAHSNQALVELEKVPNTDDKLKNALKGEALITRAYNHFMLANIFCQHYSSSEVSGLGIPYMLAPEVELKANYERGTLQETYDLIEKDVLDALPLISDEFYVGSGKYHFNKNACYAFASRFYLYKGEYEKCIEYSNKLLGEGDVSTIYIRDMEEVFTGTNANEIAKKFYNVQNPANLLVIRKESFDVLRIYRGYQCSYGIFNEVYSTALQGAKDFRDARWGFRDARVPPKYGELFRYTTSNTGRAYYIHPAFRAEEVLFNRMEAYIRVNRIDEALADYNVLASLRYANGGQLTKTHITNFFSGTEQEAMLEFAIYERRKEFLREGLRWFDIKRLNLAVTHIDRTGEVYELLEKDLRKAIQIPASAIVQGIQPNPR